MEQLASIPTLPLEVYKQITEELSKSYAIVVVKEEELDAARKAVANGAGAQRVVRERWSWLDVAGASATVRIVLEDLEAGRKHMDKLVSVGCWLARRASSRLTFDFCRASLSDLYWTRAASVIC